ncbi:MAG: T9SS type A sorting domain-containing protein [Rhodothermaceae bacterium]|nr:T9SS type A sorting domain-containing protein [Rhodothermaceae bacterium]
MNLSIATVAKRFLGKTSASFVLVMTVGLFMSLDSYAQREVVVEQGFGTLNMAIEGDTMADGSRVDPETVYILNRGERYLVNGRVTHSGYHLRVRASEGDGPLPIIQQGVRQDGTSDNHSFELNGDFTFENLWLLNHDDGGSKKSRGLIVNEPGITGVLDGCVYEVGTWLGIRINVDDVTMIVKNSVIRNLVRVDDPGNGKFIDPRSNDPALLYFENNTFYNMTSEIVRESGGFYPEFFFNHNTVYNVAALSRNDARVHKSRVMKGTFTNNLFINMAALGDITTDFDFFGGEVVDPPDVGALFPLDSLNAEDLGFMESDRDVQITNNNFFWDQELVDFYAARDTVQLLSILSPLAEAQVTEGLVTYENNYESDPGLTAPPEVANAIAYATQWYDNMCVDLTLTPECDFSTNPGEWDPFVSVAAAPWPLPEDFTYDVTSESYTGATGGFPLGDLNWFPDKKAEWEAAGGGEGVLVSNDEFDALPETFTLHGNFPNPFNPTTNIMLDLAAPAVVSVEVYDLLGRNVMTISGQQMQVGANQTINIDASDIASGIYIYQVNARTGAENFIQTGKMVLLK